MEEPVKNPDVAKRPAPTKADLGEMLTLASLWLPAWLLPESGWSVFARFLGRLKIAARPAQMRAHQRVIAQGLAALGVNRSPHDVQLRLMGVVFERYFQILREYAPWGWNPEIRVEGLDHVRQALAGGHGVLLYIYPTVFYTIIGKKGLARAGIKLVHLSRPGHGMSGTPFGQRYLNPLLTRVEDRYIGQRLTIEQGAAGRSLRPLIKALAANSVVTITANAEGRTHQVPFLGGSLLLARGAASISLASGAVLIPMMVVRERPGHYRIALGEPLQAPQASGDKDLDERRLLENYAAWLAPFVAQYPEQFAEWHNPRRWQIGNSLAVSEMAEMD